MARITLFLCSFLCVLGAFGQRKADPVAMRVGDRDVTLSELLYSFEKDRSNGTSLQAGLEAYVPLYAEYKMKVLAAEEAGLDTVGAFRREFGALRRQMLEEALVDSTRLEGALYDYYGQLKSNVGKDGLLRLSHIFIPLRQTASAEEQKVVSDRIDSIYVALRAGADFAELAKRYSQDRGAAANGGVMTRWVGRGQTLKEFEERAFALKVGQLSVPFLSTVGYHILRLEERKDFDSYEVMRGQLVQSDKLMQSLRAKVMTELVRQREDGVSEQEFLAAQESRLKETDANYRYLWMDYYEGLLNFDYTNREVWEKASKDEASLQQYYESNREKFRWSEPRFSGVVYHCAVQSDVKKVKSALKKVDEDLWLEQINKQFSASAGHGVKATKNLYAKGDNAYVDVYIYKSKKILTVLPGYPYSGVYGKKIKNPRGYKDVKTQVVTAYQNELETQLLQNLKARYNVIVYQDVIKSVYAH